MRLHAVMGRCVLQSKLPLDAQGREDIAGRYLARSPLRSVVPLGQYFLTFRPWYDATGIGFGPLASAQASVRAVNSFHVVNEEP